MKQSSKSILGWALYDWANSAFATTVMAGFFPVFFKNYWSEGIDPNHSTALLGLSNSLAGLVVAVIAPVLGAVADRGGARKRFLFLFAFLGILSTACLPLAAKGQWQWAVLLYALATVGYSGSFTFYDSLLPAVAPAGDLDRVSSLGYGLGYLGGGLLFLLNVLMTLHPAWFGLSGPAQAVRLSFLTVALWWAGFSLFTLAWVPKDPPLSLGEAAGRPLREALARIRLTLTEFRRHRRVFLFLAAYWLYIDGVDTIVRMAVDYGLSLGFKAGDLISALLITQFVGFPSAILFGRLGRIWGPKRGIYLALLVYLGVSLWAMAIDSVWEFYVMAGVVGLVQGGIQALSRSYYARLIPPGQWAEFFGFYNMLGKFAVILGPVLVGGVGLLARSILVAPGMAGEELLRAQDTATRLGIVSVSLFFLAGGALLSLVREKADDSPPPGRSPAGRETSP